MTEFDDKDPKEGLYPLWLVPVIGYFIWLLCLGFSDPIVPIGAHRKKTFALGAYHAMFLIVELVVLTRCK